MEKEIKRVNSTNSDKEKELYDLLDQYRIISSNPSFYISRKEILKE